MSTGTARSSFYNDSSNFAANPRVTSPSYKSLDLFIDVDELVSFDGLFTDLIDGDLKRKPGVPADYSDMVRETDLWEPTERTAGFEPVVRSVEMLPCNSTGCVLVNYDNDSRELPAHRNHLKPETLSELIRLRTNRKKPFYLLSNETGKKRYAGSVSPSFHAVNQYHGCDAAEGMTFSIRVDGVFSDELREQSPAPSLNPASTPALRASLEGQH